MKEIKYNHDRPLEDFEDMLIIIREQGFKPIAVTQMELEDTFVFETDEEADRAYNRLEGPLGYKPEGLEHKVVGWWFGKESFLKSVENYEKEANTDRTDEKELKMKIYWL